MTHLQIYLVSHGPVEAFRSALCRERAETGNRSVGAKDRELFLIEKGKLSLKNLAILSTSSGNQPISLKKVSETRGKALETRSSGIIVISRSNMFRGGKFGGLFHSNRKHVRGGKLVF